MNSDLIHLVDDAAERLISDYEQHCYGQELDLDYVLASIVVEMQSLYERKGFRAAQIETSYHLRFGRHNRLDGYCTTSYMRRMRRYFRSVRRH